VTERTVIAAIGPDRPGLVEEVSQFVLDRGGSIEESRMANLRGQFTIMMLVAGPAETVARLTADLAALGDATGLQVRSTEAAAGAAETAAAQHRLTARALDQVGLVHEVANVLRRGGANIESMDTTLEAAPETGAPMFAMDIILSLPASASAGELRAELGRVCDQLNIDWHLE